MGVINCTVMNWAKKDSTKIVEGREVCTDTMLLSMSLEGFTQVFAEQQGKGYDKTLNDICGSGYDDPQLSPRRRDRGRAKTFNIRSKGSQGQVTTLITARLETEIEDLVLVNFGVRG